MIQKFFKISKISNEALQRNKSQIGNMVGFFWGRQTEDYIISFEPCVKYGMVDTSRHYKPTTYLPNVLKGLCE